MKAFFYEIQAQEKAEHALRYPDYVFTPRKSGEKKKRMSPKKAKLEFERLFHSPPLPTQEQERIHRNAIKYGIIPKGTPFIAKGMEIQTTKQYDFHAGMGMDSTMLQEPFFTDGMDFNNYDDRLFENFSN